ncbi:MAG: hypothetical protein ACJ8R9_34085 [Steroidobacteraceae bacterium]
MKALVAGECRPENIFQLVDPTQFSEAAFEAEVAKALSYLYPAYLCGVFRGSFFFEGERRGADLALIHKSLSHWFVIEVELLAHSLDAHVIPQVRCFRYGEPEQPCVTSLCSGFCELDVDRAEALLRFVPRSVAVVTNRFDREWASALRVLDVQLITVSVLRNIAGHTAYEIEGDLQVIRESIGFAKYSAIDKSLRLARSSGVPLGAIQIEDPFGVAALWTVRETGSSLWITKNVGDPVLPHDEYIQLVRTMDGRIRLKLPSIRC